MKLYRPYEALHGNEAEVNSKKISKLKPTKKCSVLRKISEFEKKNYFLLAVVE